jgi:hypothetical protein
MPNVSLKAHYDGEHVVIDEPFELAPNSPLLVTVLSDGELSGWTSLAVQSLARAYGEDEPEYTLADVKNQ